TPPACSWPTSRPRSTPPAPTRASWAGSAGTKGLPTGSRCSCRTTTCAREPPSTRSRSRRCSWPRGSCRGAPVDEPGHELQQLLLLVAARHRERAPPDNQPGQGPVAADVSQAADQPQQPPADGDQGEQREDAGEPGEHGHADAVGHVGVVEAGRVGPAAVPEGLECVAEAVEGRAAGLGED